MVHFSGKILIAILIFLFPLYGNAFVLHATVATKWTGGTIYIIDDGLMPYDEPANHTYFYPPNAPINHTGNRYTGSIYTLTEDVINYGYGDAIFVNNSNIILDGNGHTIDGSGTGTGIGLAIPNTRPESDPLCYNVTIMNFTIMHFDKGIYFFDCPNETFAQNTIMENDVGIYMEHGIHASENIFYENNFIRNSLAVYSYVNWANTFFHNNFINNTVYIENPDATCDTWDKGYAIGGNYWSNYNGTDAQSGPGQNETGPDGFGDTAYTDDTIVAINDMQSGPMGLRDNYPLMNPYNYSPAPDPLGTSEPIPVAPEFSAIMILPLFAAMTMLTFKMRTQKRGS